MSEPRFDPADWYRVVGPRDPPSQGDQLFGMALRTVIADPDFPGEYTVGRFTADVIVATQSCDLEDRQVAAVEVCPTYPLATWLRHQPTGLNDLEAIRRGHVQSLYLLPGWPDGPLAESRLTRVVAIDEKRSISWHEFDAALSGRRLGMRSPYIEHFSQAIARFYMRVGLPENLPRFEWLPLAAQKVVDVSPAAVMAAGLPVPTGSLRAVIQNLQLAHGSDQLWRVSLRRDANYLGVGASVEEATDSLLEMIAKRRQAVAGQTVEPGRKPHWLLQVFPAS